MGDENPSWNVHGQEVPSAGAPGDWEHQVGTTHHMDNLDMQGFLLVKECNEIGVQIRLKKRQLKELRKLHQELIAKNSHVISDSELSSESD